MYSVLSLIVIYDMKYFGYEYFFSMLYDLQMDVILLRICFVLHTSNAIEGRLSKKKTSDTGTH